MQFSLPHKGTKDEAKERVVSLMRQHEKEIAEHAQDVKTEWKGDTLEFAFTAKGTSISGTLTVREHEYDVYAKLPLMYKMFEGTLERMIKAEIAKIGV